jgi:hypothetical protein
MMFRGRGALSGKETCMETMHGSSVAATRRELEATILRPAAEAKFR